LRKFEQNIRACEWQWVNEQKTFPVKPAGNAINKADEIYDRYRAIIEEAYK